MIKGRTLTVLLLLGVLVACSSAEERAQKYLERAQASFEAGDLVKAGLDAKNTLQIEPQNAEARFLLARIAETKIISDPSAWREMMGNLQRVIELQPDNVEARSKLIQLYLRFMASPERGQVLEMIRDQLDSALSYAPDDETIKSLEPIIVYHEADFADDSASRDAALAELRQKFDNDPSDLIVTSFLTGIYAGADPDRALDYLNRSLAAEPRSALRVLKIGLLRSQNRLADAEQEYYALIEENPDNNELRYGLARFYVEIGRNDDAEKLIREIVAADPEDVEARMRLVQFVAQSQGKAEAETLLNQFISEAPEEWQLQFQLSELQLSNQEVDRAEETLTNIIEETGTAQAGLDARNRLARIRIAQQRKVEAEQLVAEVLEEAPMNDQALMMQAALLIEGGDTDSAISNLRTVLRNDPNSEGGLLTMARAQALAGNQGLARESYQKLMQAHPRNRDGRRELARLLMRDQQWEEARALLLSGVERFPRDLEMTRMLVDTLVRVADWEAAQVQAERILQIEETRALGHYLQGRIEAAAGNLDESIESYKQAIELEPKAIEPLTNLVRSHVQLGQVEQARDYLLGFQQENPDNVHAQTLLAEVFARLRDFDRAIAENDKALEINARWVPAYRNLIGLHLLQGDLDAAEKAAEGALEVMPNNPDLRLLRATVYERQSRWDDAIAIYEAEIERNPNLDVAANNYAALVADHRQDEISLNRALQLAQRFRNSDNPIFLDTLGWLMYRTGDIEGAVKVLEEAVAGAGQVPQLRYHLGMAYFGQDRLDVAKRELQAAVSARQPYTGLEKARETLELL
ncbi:MAG: tetratricopeptide repeat protein [Gammaproteobacteria bacterium]|nr:tetratricopeptide repeat protein [Gammaproteobacteria bacterium]NNF62546.1 tetratricopeptide repeat protein [Gammaproteobacteria bacterium]NNM20751.1 tetratricopeptide repeat protein [Gammaproteobacteria bacterium]